MVSRLLTHSRETIFVVALSLLTLVVLSLLPGLKRLQGSVILLAVIAAIYIGFALSDERRNVVLIEIGIASVFVGLALLGLWVHPLALIAGYFLHGIWDLVHHDNGVRTKVVDWYPPACVVYDWIVGAALLFWYVKDAL